MRETPSLAAAPRFGAVLAASGPVILTAFGIGRQSVGWFCSVPGSAPYPPQGPYALESVPGELLFWGVLLLPVAVAGLLLRGSRRAALTAVAVVGTVLAFGLVTALLLPGLDPCTGQERTAMPPWLLIVCYPVAAGALYLAARSPLPRRPYGIVLWAGAVGAAVWAAMFHRSAITYDTRTWGVVYLRISEAPLDGLAGWSYVADVIGLPVVLVALAASLQGGRLAGAAALVLFPLLDVATYSSDFLPFTESVRWPLLVAAVLLASAARRPRTWVSWAGTVQAISERLKSMNPGRARDIAVAGVIVAAGIWLVVSSVTPTR